MSGFPYNAKVRCIVFMRYFEPFIFLMNLYGNQSDTR